jgi:hypothetical protein
MATVWRLRNNRAPPAYIDDADLTGADRGDASRIAAGLDQPASHDATRVFEGQLAAGELPPAEAVSMRDDKARFC